MSTAEVKAALRILFLGLICLAAPVLAARIPKDSAAAKDDGPVARLSSAPASARLLKNPFADDPQSEAAGRKLFLRHCGSCHGTEAYGEGHAVNLHAAEIKEVPPGVLFWAISNGRLRKGMPSWSGLPEQQRWQLVTYLKTLH